ncbi:hypothetical protein HNQ03_002230 [Chryseobacterium sp. 16F]|uniref:Uncharacterized protein n=1 Tax=Frigoriflavimonas asaccharolytica TaxID=2735899 RepID=A0A8J8G895_9FLAO|nr:hypothetical protein [Frigoriflavimonas asaccharolytica]
MEELHKLDISRLKHPELAQFINPKKWGKPAYTVFTIK